MSAKTVSPKTQIIVGCSGLAIMAAVCALFWADHHHRRGPESRGKSELTGRVRGTVVGYTGLPMYLVNQYGGRSETSITLPVIQYTVEGQVYETTGHAMGLTKVGDIVGVAYDPADPAAASGYGGGAWELRLVMIVGGLVMALCLVAIVVGARGMIKANK